MFLQNNLANIGIFVTTTKIRVFFEKFCSLSGIKDVWSRRISRHFTQVVTYGTKNWLPRCDSPTTWNCRAVTALQPHGTKVSSAQKNALVGQTDPSRGRGSPRSNCPNRSRIATPRLGSSS